MANPLDTMSGKVCLVTGANAGIGYATALGLARLGAKVRLVCRDRQRGEEARGRIRDESGNEQVSLLLADLASLASIRGLATEFRASHPALDVLVNNAATIPRRRQVTVDGLEQQFAVNHLAYFLLTHLLFPSLRAAAPARIVNVASRAHFRGNLDFGDLQSERSYRPTAVYSTTKLANVLFTHELARRIEGSGVTANCLHPGVIATGLLGRFLGLPRVLGFLLRPMFGSAEKGAKTSLHLASCPDLEDVSGKYFERRKPRHPAAASLDRSAAERLWSLSAELAGVGSDALSR